MGISASITDIDVKNATNCVMFNNFPVRTDKVNLDQARLIGIQVEQFGRHGACSMVSNKVRVIRM